MTIRSLTMAYQKVPERSHPDLQAKENEYRKRMGKLEGIVRQQGDRYWFCVRDITREEFTIHGFGVDFQQAVTAVEQLMELLREDLRRDSGVREDPTVPDPRPKAV